jgi:hypothetical protein
MQWLSQQRPHTISSARSVTVRGIMPLLKRSMSMLQMGVIKYFLRGEFYGDKIQPASSKDG